METDTMYPNGRPPKNLPDRFFRNQDAVAILAVNSGGQLLVCNDVRSKCWTIPGGVASALTVGETAVSVLLEKCGIEVAEEGLEELAMFWDYMHRGLASNQQKMLLYMLRDAGECLETAFNACPTSYSDMYWVSPAQVPFPRSLVLRVAMELIG